MSWTAKEYPEARPTDPIVEVPETRPADLLRTGDRVRIDGTRGVVEVLPRA